MARSFAFFHSLSFERNFYFDRSFPLIGDYLKFFEQFNAISITFLANLFQKTGSCKYGIPRLCQMKLKGLYRELPFSCSASKPGCIRLFGISFLCGWDWSLRFSSNPLELISLLSFPSGRLSKVGFSIHLPLLFLSCCGFGSALKFVKADSHVAVYEYDIQSVVLSS